MQNTHENEYIMTFYLTIPTQHFTLIISLKR